jgi:shikimate dehydrogenase
MVIANRTPERAIELTREFASLGPLAGCGFAELAGERFHLIINATAASLQGVAPPLPEGVLSEAGTCYDLMYAAQRTPFLDWGAAQGAGLLADGLGMLVEQAAASFARWRGVQPRTQPVIAWLRQQLQTHEH